MLQQFPMYFSSLIVTVLKENAETQEF